MYTAISTIWLRRTAIILISSDLPEVLAMSDRVLVMREGLSRGVFDAVDSTQESIMTAAVGAS
jgi:ribose transport system ATP-binding protein